MGYDFWGHIDNDLLLGDIHKFFTAEVLNNFDVIPGWSDVVKNYRTWVGRSVLSTAFQPD